MPCRFVFNIKIEPLSRAPGFLHPAPVEIIGGEAYNLISEPLAASVITNCS